MIKEALQYVADLAPTKIQTANGKAYADTELVELESPDPVAAPLAFHSLSGLVSYAVSDHDNGNPAHPKALYALVVDGPDAVRFVSQLFGDFRQREVLASASPYVGQPFPFGKYLDIETFVTELQAKFVADESTAAVLAVVGNIKHESQQTLADDGVTQVVAARTGIQLLANVKVPNPVVLRPFRTFPEIVQPASKYVLRVRREDDGPAAALFEVTDNQWKHSAVFSIEGELRRLLDVAGSSIKIFA